MSLTPDVISDKYFEKIDLIRLWEYKNAFLEENKHTHTHTTELIHR